jgi:hypothetical protein
MTDGEKMIWASLFGHEYAKRMSEFRVAMDSLDTYEAQKNEHRRHSATLAAEAATLGLLAAREIQTEDIGDETQEMMSHIFECDTPPRLSNC